MSKFRLLLALFMATVLLCCLQGQALATNSITQLRLIPFPKSVTLENGSYKISSGLDITVSDTQAGIQAATDLAGDIRTFFRIKCRVKPLPQMKANAFSLHIGTKLPTTTSLPTDIEGYILNVSANGIDIKSIGAAGLVNGIQTLRQLVIANSTGSGIPCVEIRDYPSLQYRGFQDDITRGRNSQLKTFEMQVRNARYLRMNFFTYYLEHQFAFAKNPVIGPANGSLTPADLKSLVSYSKNYDVDIVGCQQSLGHFYHILKHPEYAHLKEGGDCLDPTNEGTYKLLDEMYSEQLPLLESPLFNIDCDETYELGTGPSKPLAQKIGVGGVYTQHIKRVHDLITNKYGKRMMMWGDIILQHPENLNDIPKDTIMLSWGYHAGASFDDAVTPFKNSGYDFFVCPGVSSWSRILPDFNTANINIRNYVRSGVKYGAMGMLNTSWGDDGENLMGYNWHGIAWGAECSWAGSKTNIEDFNKRIGAVMFGEKGEEFGKAITLLTKTHSLPGYGGMGDGRFWQGDFGSFAGRQSALNQANSLLNLVNPALKHLYAAKKDARINADQIDYFIFGTQRMKLMGDRMLAYMDAAEAYQKAYANQTNRSIAKAGINKAMTIFMKTKAEHVALRNRYIELWNREARPYSLDGIAGRYNTLIEKYDVLIKGLGDALECLETGKELPAGDKIGLGVVETSVRRSIPDSQANSTYLPETAWQLADFDKRIGFSVSAGEFTRSDQPVELDVTKLNAIAKGVQLVQFDPVTSTQSIVPSQIITQGKASKLVFLAAGTLQKGTDRTYFLYFSPTKAYKASEDTTIRITDAPNGKLVESDKLRLLIGTEGGHIYRWEVKSMNNLDLTHPGDTDWSGFADINGVSRNAPNNIEVLADGPVLTRIRLKDTIDVVKTITVWSGVEWAEVNLDSGTSWFCNYDDYKLMGVESKIPGTYIMSNGESGPLKPMGNGLSCTNFAEGLTWAAKYVPNSAMIGMLTPEVGTTMIVGPGDGMGAVSLNYGPEASHFVIYGGKAPASPGDTLSVLKDTLDYRHWPKTRLYAIQEQKQK